MLADELSARGFRLTQQRRALLETIDAAPELLDAGALLKLARARDASINRATVYRTLELLKRLGLVDRPVRSEARLACLRCGRVEEFPSALVEKLSQEIAREKDFRVEAIRLEARGRCSGCN